MKPPTPNTSEYTRGLLRGAEIAEKHAEGLRYSRRYESLINVARAIRAEAAKPTPIPPEPACPKRKVPCKVDCSYREECKHAAAELEALNREHRRCGRCFKPLADCGCRCFCRHLWHEHPMGGQCFSHLHCLCRGFELATYDVTKPPAPSQEKGTCEPIHYSDWAQQPDIRIACDQSYTTPAWGDAKTETNGVYKSADGRLYVFWRDLATCPKCTAQPTNEGRKP